MSTLKSKESPATAPSPSKQRPYFYAGLNGAGRICLERDGKTLVVNGAVYASTTPAAGQTKVVLVPLNSTPDYQRNPQHKKYLARTATGETFRVIGVVEEVRDAVVPIKRKGIRTLVSVPAKPLDIRPNRPASPPKHPVTTSVQPAKAPRPAATLTADDKKKAKLARLEELFQRVMVLRDRGIDPDVRMAFVAYYLGESQANLYRRCAAGQFPTPIRRGRSTYWFLSQLDAFKAGTWKPTNT